MALSSTTDDATADLHDWLAAQENKDLLRFVTIGSVDDGKSTLIGRLLHDAHGVYEDQLNAVRRASFRGSTRGEGSTSEIDFSLFTDGLAAEREQGITIDVAYRYFATERRKFIIADTPGHVQYTRNMATGASTASVAVILVDARTGVVAQTRRHAHIAALLGIPHVIACVNKMDLVGYDERIFETIRAEVETIGRFCGLRDVFAIPMSALRGDNVVVRSERTPWWRGPALLEHLETVHVEDDKSGAAFRLPIQLVLRPHQGYRGFAGRILAGTIREGDEVVALPSGKKSRVTGVDVHGHAVPEAFASMNVALRLSDEIDVSRGDMLVAGERRPTVSTDIDADIVWLSERGLDRSRTYLLKHTTRIVRAEVHSIMDRVDLETLERVPAESLGLNDIARVHVRSRTPIFFDPYAQNRGAGAFILIDALTNDTVAAGMIRGTATGTLERPAANGARLRSAARDARARSTRSSSVDREERRARLGQLGAVLYVSARTVERSLELAYALERGLFDRGRIASVLPFDDDGERREWAGDAVANAGVLAIVVLAGRDEGVSIEGHALELREPTTKAEAFDDDARVGELVGAVDERLTALALVGTPSGGPRSER